MPVEYSVILAGKYGVGKSCIFERLKTGEVPERVSRGTSRSTCTWGEDDGGLDSFVYQRQVAGKKIKVTLWDTGSQERYDSMTANYYRNAHAVIFVYAVDEEGTLFALNEWVAEATKLSRQGDRLVMALWGSKSDLPANMHVVSEDAVDAFVSTHHIPEKLNRKVNVLDSSLEEAMMLLMEHMENHFNGQDTQVENRFDDILKLCEPAPPQPTFAEKLRSCCRGSN